MSRAKLPGSGALLVRSLKDLRRHWKLYLAVVVLVALPTNLIETYFSPGAGLQSWLSIAGLFMNVAVLYAIIRHHRSGDRIGLRTAYYSSSHAVLRYFIVLIWLGLMLLPAAAGSQIYLAGVSGAVSPSVGEQALLALAALIVSLPSIWLIIRFVLAMVAVVDHEARPMTALKLSWNLTEGRFWAVLGRLIMLVLWSALLLALPLIILGVLYALLHWLVWLMLMQLAASLFGLPLYALYAFYLYEALGGGEAFGKGGA